MKNKITDEEYARVLKELETAKDGYYRNMLIAVANRYNGKTDTWTKAELGLPSRQAVSRLICGFKKNGLDYYKNAENKRKLECCYTFEDIYRDSSLLHVEIMGTDIGEAERIFSNVLTKACIPVDFFKAPTGEYRFNEYGRELAIDVLNNYKSDVYKQLRRQHYSDETAEKYAFLIGNSIFNYQAICSDYPREYVNLNRTYPSAIAQVFSNIFRNIGNFDSCPGMSFLGGLPSTVNQNAALILDDIAYIDSIVYAQFVDEHEGRDALRKKWLRAIDEILQYRIEERDRINKLLESEDFVTVAEYVDNLLSEVSNQVSYEKATSLSKERVWVSHTKQNDRKKAAIIEKMLKETYNLHQNPSCNPDQAALFSKLQLLPIRENPETVLNRILNPTDDETEPAQ